MLKLLKRYYLYIVSFFIVIILLTVLFHRTTSEETVPDYNREIHNYNFKFIPETPNSNSLFDITNFSFLIEPDTHICDAENGENRTIIKAIFIVTSHISNVETRSAMRRAFPKGDLLKLGVRRVFLLGRTLDNKYINQKAVEDEARKYGDIVQGNFQEAYRNLTYKHVMGLMWVNRYCDTTQFIIKMDDDIVVDMMKLMVLLKKFNSEEEFISGYVLKDLEVKRLKANKWYVAKEEYAPDTYPPFVSGWLYITTTTVSKKLEEMARKEDYFWIDDAFITGIVAKKINVKLYDIKEYFTDHPEYFQCCLNEYADRKLDCDIIVGPNGGRTNLFYEFNKVFSLCYREGCNKRQYKVNESCSKSAGIQNLGRGNAIVSSYKLIR